MVAVCTCSNLQKTYKVRCPECRSRICDLTMDGYERFRNEHKIVTDRDFKSQITIKCHKCGQICGIALVNM